MCGSGGGLLAVDPRVALSTEWSIRHFVSQSGARFPPGKIVALARRLTGLAWALRGAAAMDHWWSENSRLDVLWTGPVACGQHVSQDGTGAAGNHCVRQAELWLVSFAGYKLPQVRDALLAAAERDVRVQWVIESPEESQGKVTFSALEGLGARLAEVAVVYIWPLSKRPRNEKGQHGSLHVKCALADDERLFVSSANLTEFAMSLNMELGVLARGGALPASIGAHFHWLVEQRILVAVPKS